MRERKFKFSYRVEKWLIENLPAAPKWFARMMGEVFAGMAFALGFVLMIILASTIR